MTLRRFALLIGILFTLFSGISHAQEKSEPPVHPFSVPAGEQVSQVEVNGNKLVTSDQILEAVSTKIGDTLEEAKLQRDVHSIYDLGLFTDVRVETVKLDQGTKVVFVVVENPIVNDIEISGTQIVPNSKILSLMKTTTGKILNTRTLYGDVLAINQYYSNEGYTEPSNHVADLAWSKEGKVTLKIQEGIVIKSIVIRGNTVYPESRIRPLVHSQVGDVFNRKKIEADLGNVAKLYKKDDYILDGLKGNISPDGIATIDITETKVEGMRVEGNTKTKDYVIYRQIKTKVGDVLREKRMQKDIERLNNTGYFETVNVEPEEGTEPGKVILVWKVKEQKTGSASFGIGYSGGGGAGQGGLSGAISVSERNIRGTGQSVYLQWQRGIYANMVSLGFQAPAIDKAEDSIAVSFFNSDFYNQIQALPGAAPVQFQFFSDHQTGGNLTVGRPVIDEDTHVFLTYTHESIATFNISAPAGFTASPPIQGTIVSLAPSLVHDTRDDVFDTTRGNFVSASYERAGTPFGGSFQYNKYQGDLRGYFSAPFNSTFALRFLGGWGTGNLPITNWYVLGGPDTLRGYDLNRFIGTRMFLTAGELRFPLGKQKMFKGAIFAEAGNAFQPGQTVTLGKLFTDYGFGIRVKLPSLGLGIIRLDYALGGEGSRTVIGIGQTF